jgi:hypothetical protein
MKHIARLATILLIASTAATWAGNTLSMRLVEASNGDGGMDSSLNDVASALRGQLAFKSYRRVASGSVPLPANSNKASLSGYTITCSGPQNALAIKISKGRSNLVSTTVNLRDGRPLLLGGFPSKNGKMIVVFIAR